MAEEHRDVWEHGPSCPQLLPHLDGPAEQQHEGAGHHALLPLSHLAGRLHQVEGVDGSPLQCQPSVHCICSGRLHQAHIQVFANLICSATSSFGHDSPLYYFQQVGMSLWRFFTHPTPQGHISCSKSQQHDQCNWQTISKHLKGRCHSHTPGWNQVSQPYLGFTYSEVKRPKSAKTLVGWKSLCKCKQVSMLQHCTLRSIPWSAGRHFQCHLFSTANRNVCQKPVLEDGQII